jgi:hypothetical protein
MILSLKAFGRVDVVQTNPIGPIAARGRHLPFSNGSASSSCDLGDRHKLWYYRHLQGYGSTLAAQNTLTILCAPTKFVNHS